MSRVPRSTPWGRVQQQHQQAKGITWVSTAGHGGLYLTPERNAEMPVGVRKDDGWYEEDCEWALVALRFPECFSAEHVGIAISSAKNWFPSMYQILTGQEVKLSESQALRRKVFAKETRNHYVTTSAMNWGKGVVRVTACRESDKDHKVFEIPKEDYLSKGEFGYVIWTH